MSCGLVAAGYGVAGVGCGIAAWFLLSWVLLFAIHEDNPRLLRIAVGSGVVLLAASAYLVNQAISA